MLGSISCVCPSMPVCYPISRLRTAARPIRVRRAVSMPGFLWRREALPRTSRSSISPQGEAEVAVNTDELTKMLRPKSNR